MNIWYFVNNPVPSVSCCDRLDRCFRFVVFMFALLCFFYVATVFSVNKRFIYCVLMLWMDFCEHLGVVDLHTVC